MDWIVGCGPDLGFFLEKEQCSGNFKNKQLLA